MAEFPALPIFTDAFIADTLHLNALQTGAYFMLLMVAWRTKECALPDDDDRLAAFARLDKRTWLKNRDVILSFWHRNNAGHLYQKRLTDERKLAEDRRNQAVQAGRASALKRKERHSTDVITEGQQNANYPKPNPLPLYKDTKEVSLLAAEKPPRQPRVIEYRLDHWMSMQGIEDIPEEWGDYSHDKLGMTVSEINLEWDKFTDYWKSTGGTKGKKADWKATWNNWCRNSIEYKQQRK